MRLGNSQMPLWEVYVTINKMTAFNNVGDIGCFTLGILYSSMLRNSPAVCISILRSNET